MKKSLFLCFVYATTTVTMLGAEHTVDQKDKAFSAAEITVKPGDTIVFKNSDVVAHNVFSGSAQNKFAVPIQQPGACSSVTFNEEGVTEVRCAIHPKMKIVVTVKK